MALYDLTPEKKSELSARLDVLTTTDLGDIGRPMTTISRYSEALGNRSGSITSTGLARIEFTRRRENPSLETENLLRLLRTRSPRFFERAEVVGRWVWARFAQPPKVQTRRQLAQLGFHWNSARQAWPHPCGVFRDRRVRFDPRRKFGSYFAADLMNA